jgi:hypothetical protein
MLHENLYVDLNVGEGLSQHGEELADEVVTTVHVTSGDVSDVVGREELFDRIEVPVGDQRGVGCLDPGHR